MTSRHQRGPSSARYLNECRAESQGVTASILLKARCYKRHIARACRGNVFPPLPPSFAGYRPLGSGKSQPSLARTQTSLSLSCWFLSPQARRRRQGCLLTPVNGRDLVTEGSLCLGRTLPGTTYLISCVCVTCLPGKQDIPGVFNTQQSAALKISFLIRLEPPPWGGGYPFYSITHFSPFYRLSCLLFARPLSYYNRVLPNCAFQSAPQDYCLVSHPTVSHVP